VTSGTTTVTYDYDAAGQLVRRSRNGAPERYYLWDGGQLLAELDSAANAREAEYAYGGTDAPLVLITGTPLASIVRYYAQDAVGNVVGLFNSATPNQTLRYDPWGNLENVTTASGDTTDLRWKGLLYEGDVTSMYYVRARWYDPVSRRFISADPLGVAAGLNQFAYAGGDPINGTDPSGMLYCDDDGCIDDSGGGTGGGDGPAQPIPGPTITGTPDPGQWITWDYVNNFGSPPPPYFATLDGTGGAGGGAAVGTNSQTCNYYQQQAAALGAYLDDISNKTGLLAIGFGISALAGAVGEVPSAGADTPLTAFSVEAAATTASISKWTGRAAAALNSFAAGNVTAVFNAGVSEVVGKLTGYDVSSIPGLGSYKDVTENITSQLSSVVLDGPKACN
jgi:RHS repeat-associated protein